MLCETLGRLLLKANILEKSMTEIVRLESAEPVIYGVLKLRWKDGYEGVVDLRSILTEADVFTFLRDDPERFARCSIDQWGNHVFWLDGDGEEIELGTIALRKRAERQAAILELAS